MINARVVLLVDASRGLLNNKVIIKTGPVRSGIGRREKCLRRGVQPIRADYIKHSVALKLRAPWQALIVDCR